MTTLRWVTVSIGLSAVVTLVAMIAFVVWALGITPNCGAGDAWNWADERCVVKPPDR